MDHRRGYPRTPANVAQLPTLLDLAIISATPLNREMSLPQLDTQREITDSSPIQLSGRASYGKSFVSFALNTAQHANTSFSDRGW